MELRNTSVEAKVYSIFATDDDAHMQSSAAHISHRNRAPLPGTIIPSAWRSTSLLSKGREGPHACRRLLVKEDTQFISVCERQTLSSKAQMGRVKPEVERHGRPGRRPKQAVLVVVEVQGKTSRRPQWR
jgi:hypothetical protein